MSSAPPPGQESLPEVAASEESQRFNRDNLRRVPLAAMKPAPYNPREITDEAFDALKATVEEFGMVEAIVWNQRSGHIVGGHQRYRLLAEAKQVDTWAFVVDLDEPEEMALNLALNNPNAQGTFRAQAVTDIVKLLKSKKSPEAFKRSGLAALEKQLPLFDGKPAAPKAATQPTTPVAGGSVPAGTATPPSGITTSEPKPDTKVVQIFLSAAEYKEFQDGVQVCLAALSCQNASETVFRLVKMASAKLRPAAPPKSSDASVGSSRKPDEAQAESPATPAADGPTSQPAGDTHAS